MHPSLVEVVKRTLSEDKRDPTGLLHCSSDSWKPLRFIQLASILDVKDTEDYGDLMTMKLGTLAHEWLASAFEQNEALGPDWRMIGTELDVTPYLPLGWGGTLDYMFIHNPTGRVVISDLKSINPDSVAYLGGKPKKEHVIQVSCYRAAIATKYPEFDIDPDISILYLPKGKSKSFQTVEPIVLTAPAIPTDQIFNRLRAISFAVARYKSEYEITGEIINGMLDPMPPPEMKIYWDAKQGNWNVSSRASWYEEYLTAGLPDWTVPRTPTMKLGHWSLDGAWIPRKGIQQPDYESIPRPSREEIDRRRR